MRWKRWAFECLGHVKKNRPRCTTVFIKTIVKTGEIHGMESTCITGKSRSVATAHHAVACGDR